MQITEIIFRIEISKNNGIIFPNKITKKSIDFLINDQTSQKIFIEVIKFDGSSIKLNVPEECSYQELLYCFEIYFKKEYPNKNINW